MLIIYIDIKSKLTFASSTMRNFILYFFTGLFLFFVIESKLSAVNLKNNDSSLVSHHLPKKSNRSNLLFEKISLQQMDDDAGNYSIELEEDDFRLSENALSIIIFAGISGIFCFTAFKYQRQQPLRLFQNLSGIFNVKKYLLICTIRI